MNTNFNMSIPKPCHEDWNKFTPDEKGAFCKVCSKSVHDFTRKTALEIKTILVDEIGSGKKVCGRFNKEQLTPLPEIIPSLSPYDLNFTRLKKFALALFLVFGGYLFNSVKSFGQMMGDVRPNYEAPQNNAAPFIETTPTSEPNKCGLIDIKGDVKVETMGKVIGEQIKGRVSITQEPYEIMGLLVADEPFIEDTLISTQPEDTLDWMMLGEVAFMEDSIAAPLVPIDSGSSQHIVCEEFAVEESTNVEMMESENVRVAPEANELAIECYPNPSSGLITIKYNVKESAPASMLLYDMNGSLVKTLISPQTMYAADYNTQFDISELPDGVYFCTLQSGDKKSTQRIILGK